MREQLEKKYKNIFEKYDLPYPMDARNITITIKNLIIDFLKDAKNPAIYCNGGHTKMLMSDFMYELKSVKIIIDNYADDKDSGGFKCIADKDIEAYNVDAVIISSFKFRKDIKNKLQSLHKNVRILDFYEELEKQGIVLQSDYYYCNHPYHQYHTINKIQNQIKEEDTENKEELYKSLIAHYLQIKDFRTAISKAEELYAFCSKEIYKEFLDDITDIYNLELEACRYIPQNHVLMFCFDGLRRRDLSEKYMPKLYKCMSENACMFTNAYSCSTSTYESLVPAYSGNDDLRTKYYEKNSVDEKDCAFVQTAKKQGRSIHVYGDVFHYIDGEDIKHEDTYQTVTEKLWSFILDAVSEKNGLYYIHELYESHFSFSNPYTDTALISEGTALLFDFLPQKGGKLRTDYNRQHIDALRYIDDVAAPFVERIMCNMVLYADHGNLILNADSKISDVIDLDYTCSEQWTQIPLVIRSGQQSKESNNILISLKSISDIINSLLKNEKYTPCKKEFIKIMRSELYNPDFRFLYKSIDKARYLSAFEAFVFDNGYKLVIYSDGYIELYRLPEEKRIDNKDVVNTLLEKVSEEISVCNIK